MSFIMNFSPDQRRVADFARLAAEEVDGVRDPSEKALVGVAEELVADKEIVTITNTNGDLLAAASYWVDSEDCILDTLVSNPDYRGQGFGRLALNIVETVATDEGANRVELYSLDSANSFYQRMGYESVVDEDRPFVTHQKNL